MGYVTCGSMIWPHARIPSKILKGKKKHQILPCAILRLQRNYHVCIRRITRPQAYWPRQYAPAQHHDRRPARDQGCYGRMSRDTPANRSSRSRHDDAELSSRGKRSNRVVHGPGCRANALTFRRPETLQFEGRPSSIHAPPRVSCSSGTLHV